MAIETFDREALAVLCIHVFRCQQSYGGPEEGGWWYEEGEVLASIPVRSIIYNQTVSFDPDAGFDEDVVKNNWRAALTEGDYALLEKEKTRLQEMYGMPLRQIHSAQSWLKVSLGLGMAKNYPEEAPRYE